MLSRAEEELLAEYERDTAEDWGIERQEDIDTDEKTWFQEWTALHRAAEGGHGNIVAYLLAHNPPSFSDAKTYPQFYTALHFAAEGGHGEIVAQLLAHKPALIDDVTHLGDTALHLAARGGYNKIVQLLLSIKPELANVRNIFESYTALHEAVRKGRNEVVEQLLPLADSSQLETAMLEAARKGHANIMARLIALNPSLADVHTEDWVQETPLHLAVKNGHEEVVAQLLAFSPQSCDVRATVGQTVLHLAAERGHDKIVEQLLAHSPALIDARDSSGHTALFLATREGHETTALRLLAHNPDSIDAKAGSNNLLHEAALAGHAKIVAELLARRPSLADEANYQGRTPLFCAASEGHQEVVELFPLTAKQVQRRDYLGNTLLHAVTAQRPALVQRVWEMNPDALFIVCDVGFTPFGCALSALDDWFIEHFQWKLSMEQIEEAFDSMRRPTKKQLYEERFQEVVKGECGRLLLLLPRDCVNVIYEYLFKEKRTES